MNGEIEIVRNVYGCAIKRCCASCEHKWIDYGFLTLFTAYSIMRAFKMLLAQWIDPLGNVVIPYVFTDFTI